MYTILRGQRAGITSMYTILQHRHLRWLGYVSCMKDGRIPKDLLWGGLATRKRPMVEPSCVSRTSASVTRRPCDRCACRQKVLKGSFLIWRRLAWTFCCAQCSRDRPPCIGLCSHSRCCSRLLYQRVDSIVPWDWRMPTDRPVVSHKVQNFIIPCVLFGQFVAYLHGWLVLGFWAAIWQHAAHTTDQLTSPSC